MYYLKYKFLMFESFTGKNLVLLYLLSQTELSAQSLQLNMLSVE